MLVAWTALAVVGSLLTPPRCGVVSMGGSNSNGGAKKKPASRGGGFGAAPPPPPTLDEVCASFPQRLPKDTSVSCPCGSGESYADCCRPYHVGEKTPQTPETCLRARYSGFCYRLPKFIIESTDMRYRISTAEHPAHPYLDPYHPLSRHVSPLRDPHRNPSYPTP